MKQCAIEGCEKPRHTRVWCNGHYKRWLKYGDPLATGQRHPNGLSVEARFLRHVDKTTPLGCWRWTGRINTRGRGYGVFSWREDGKIKTEAAHRFAYRLWVGPIPAGMDLDHVLENGCRYTDCVRAPDHLEPVTEAENTRRYLLSLTHCRNGHPYAKYGFPGTTGQRCSECQRQTYERYNAHLRELTAARGPLPLKTHCTNGHEFLPGSFTLGGKLGTTRLCKQCGRDRSAAWKAKQLGPTSS